MGTALTIIAHPREQAGRSWQKASTMIPGQVFSPAALCGSKGWTWGNLPSKVCAIPDLSMGAKVTYSALAQREATQSGVFPSIKKLSEAIGVTAKQARRYILELQRAGLIEVIRRQAEGKAGLNESNVYTFLWSSKFEDSISPAHGIEVVPEDDITPVAVGTPKNVLTQEIGTPKNGSRVLPRTSAGYSQERETNKNIEKEHLKRTPLECALELCKKRIFLQHPLARRDLGEGGIEKALKLILKHKKYSGQNACEYLEQVVDRHGAHCRSHDWTKDQGRFAKSLSNYLAASMERYDVEIARTTDRASQQQSQPGLRAGEIE